jgi:tetratricopeptide (TPR) repeat protein
VDAAPGDASAWKELGRSLSTLGRVRAQEALDALHRSLELTPEAGTQFLLGCLYRQEGLYDLASESFGKALERDPAHMGARLAMAALKIQEGRVREGNADIEAIGALPPEYAAEFDRRIKEAVERLLDARRLMPDTREDDMAYAKVMLRAERFQEALEAAERCARLAPNDEAALNFIGDVAGQLGLRDRAREAYTRSLELKPDQPRTKERLQALDQPAK